MTGAVTPESLATAAATYLGRYAASEAGLRRVLMRRVERWARRDGTDPVEAAAAVAAVIDRFRALGVLDDQRYATARAHAWRQRGGSARAVAQRLAAHGIDGAHATAALDAATDQISDLAAAAAFARRRRLGPFRLNPDPAERQRDLGRLARAGFDRRTAEAILECADPDAVMALLSAE